MTGISELDNRDPSTTWIWPEKLEVDPIDLMGNMIENCYNEDVSFLFEQFTAYLRGLDEFPDIKDDNKSDHIALFADYLDNMVTSGRTGQITQTIIDACANGKHNPFTYPKHPSGDVVTVCRYCRIPMPTPKTGD